MTIFVRRFACGALSLGLGCAPTTLATRTETEILRTEKVLNRGHDRVVTALLRDHDDGATLVLTSAETCDEQQVRVVRRQEITEQKADVSNQVLLYLLAAAGVGLGATFVGDANNIPAPDDPTTRNPVGRTGAYALGGVALSIGAVFLGLGIGTTARGRDLVNDLGETTEDDGPSTAIACNERPMANAHLTLAVAGAAEKKSLGATDADGHVQVRWKDLRALLVGGAAATRGTIEIDGTADRASIDLAPALRYWAQHILEESRALLADGKTSEASERLRVAEFLGADVAAERRPIEAARAEEQRQKDGVAALEAARVALESGSVLEARSLFAKAESLGAPDSQLASRLAVAAATTARKKVATAWTAIKRGDLDAAADAVAVARELGLVDGGLDAALAQLQRRKEAEDARRAAVEEKRRAAEETQRAANAEREERRRIKETERALREARQAERRRAFAHGECPGQKIAGQLVGRLADGLYEFVHIEIGVVGFRKQARPDLGQLGQIGDGYNDVPQYGEIAGKHALVATRRTKFQSTGRFELCVTDDIKKRSVPTKSGFTEVWDVYTEELP